MIRFVFPDKVKEVGDYAFAGCKNLKSVSMTESVSYISSSAFSNCVKLTIYCPMYSYAAIYAMDNGIPTNFTQDFPYDLEAVGLNFDHSSYYLDMLKLSASGTIDFTIDYSIKDEWYSEMSDMMITVHIPNNAELVNKSLRKDGVAITDFTNSDNTLKFGIADKSGKVHFSLKPEDQVQVKSYASISYVVNGEVHQDIIGIIDTTLPVLTLDMDKTTNSGNVQVTGIAPSQAEVNIYVGDEQVSSVHASRAGKYSAAITVPTDKMYATYTVTAKCIDSKAGILSAFADVTYGSDYPEINKFIMQYNGKEYDLLDINNKNPIITFVPSKSMTFEVKFDNADSVEDVYVVSDRNNVKKYLKAEYDNKTNSFITNGNFDPQNNSYVPGTITVEYSRKKKQIPISSDYDFLNEIINPTLGDKVTGSTSSTTTEGNVTTTTVRFDGDVGELISDEIKLVVTTMDSQYGADLSGILKGYEGFYSYLFDADGKKYVLNLDYTDPKTYVTTVHDISGNKMIKYAVSAWETPSNSVAVSDILDKLGTAKYVTGAILDMLEINEADEELRDKIADSNMSLEEKQEAYKKADELNQDRQMFLLLSTVISVAVTGFAGPSAVVFGLLFGAITTSSSFFWDARMAGILEGGSGVSASWRWKVDPSGTVYEAVPTNPLPGVTATAYYKDTDTGEKVLWNAEEWDQTNPLLTDEVGFYAWDVPEGLWQVSFEKDGYESKVSEWVEVAPPQTDVNASLVSRVSPVIESYIIGDSFAEVTFSKYMKPDTVGALVLKDGNGKIIPYILEYDSGEISDSGEILARTYHLVYEDYVALPDSEYSITTNESILSYSGAKTVSNVYKQEAKLWNVIIVGNSRNEIKDNETIKLIAKYRDSDEELKNCIWSIRDIDQEYASITQDGVVTAKTIVDGKTHHIVVSVKTSENGEVESMYKLTIVPSGSGDNSSGVLPEDIPNNGIIPDGIWSAGIIDTVYTGSNITQSFRLYDGNKRLQEKVDYTISYKNNRSAYTYTDEDYADFISNLKNTGKSVKFGSFDPKKAPQVIIRMKGNYSGSKTIYFRIRPADLAGDGFSASDLAVTYSGKKQSPIPTVTWNGKTLKYGTDFYIPEYDNVKNDKTAFLESGTYKLNITGKNNFTGAITIKYVISDSKNQIAMNGVTIKGIRNQAWTGKQIKPDGYTIKYKTDVLEENSDYNVVIGENNAVGTGTITFIGNGTDNDGDGYSYIGTKTVSFKITGTAMSKVTVGGVEKSYTYTGEAIKPNAILTYKANKNSTPVTLEKDTHYTVTYQKNQDKGTATIVFTGIESSGYTGTKKTTFKIAASGIADRTESGDSIEQIKISYKDVEKVKDGIYVAPYMKGGAKPEVIVTSGSRMLKLGKDYTVSYANNKKIALSTDRKAPTITIKGKGNYSGSKKVTFSIAVKPLSEENGITVTTKDKVVSAKKNGYRQSFKVYDADGKALGRNDYDSQNIVYTLVQTKAEDGAVNEVLDNNSIVPADSVIRITVQGKGNYAGGSISGTYRILQVNHDIGKATIQINNQEYTGQPVEITDQSQFKTEKVYIKIGRETKVLELGKDIEVMLGSYVKNVNKGTAKVTFRGINDFGGTKTVSYKIGTRSIADYWSDMISKIKGLMSCNEIQIGSQNFVVVMT